VKALLKPHFFLNRLTLTAHVFSLRKENVPGKIHRHATYSEKDDALVQAYHAWPYIMSETFGFDSLSAME
jgi:hypothetical protein